MRKVLFIFGELNDFDVDWMIATGTKKQVTEGTVLIHEGKPVDALFIVLEGLFSVNVAALNNQRIAQLVAGEIVGEMSFIEARPPSATVRAETAATVLSIPRSQLTAKLKQDTAFAARFYRALAIFLSFRLRNTVAQFAQKSGQAPSEESADELDANILDNVFLAGARFDRMVRRLIGQH